jgi:hypothetical protein
LLILVNISIKPLRLLITNTKLLLSKSSRLKASLTKNLIIKVKLY